MHFTIREATIEDYDTMNEVYREGDLVHQVALPHVFRDPEGPARSFAYVSGLLLSEDYLILVAEQEGEIIGLAQGCIRTTPDYPILVPRKYAHLEDIVVRREHRRCGVGRALLERFHQWAVEKGASAAELNVWEFNESAVEAYKALGYEFASHRMWKKLSSDNADSE